MHPFPFVRAFRCAKRAAPLAILASTLLASSACSDSHAGTSDADVADAASHPSDSGHDAASSSGDAGSSSGADAGASDSGADGGTNPTTARVVVIGTNGEVASLDIRSPWTVRASADLGSEIASAHCRGTRCLVVHPAPTDTVELIRASDLSIVRTFTLAHEADARDVTWIDDDTALVTQYGSAYVVELDLTTGTATPIDLGALADADGIPESRMASSCGSMVYVQLGRVDHDTEAPSTLGAALAVLDLSKTGASRVVDVDPVATGVQGIALAGRADFDMPIDCAAGLLYVAEPKPLFSGGGAYEVVDLTTRTASDFPYSGAQIGGFDVVASGLVWRITHTDFGPGASSHLELVGGVAMDTYNTFSGYHVDDVALDRASDLLFFPDPCTVTPSNAGCRPGVHVFHANTGYEATTNPIVVGFEAIEIAIAR